jgi:hypothetical protein
VVTNEFIHFAGTLDDASGLMKLYLNGVLVAQSNTTVRPVGDLGNFGSGLGIGHGQDGTTFAFGLNGVVDEVKLYSRALTAQEVQMLHTNAPCSDNPEGVEFNLSRDFSLASNPNGAWSYGRQDLIGGSFTLFGLIQTNIAGNGVPILVRLMSPNNQPAILHNDTTETATSSGGGSYAPETTWFAPGVEGQPGHYVVTRLTVPPGAGGAYRLATTARPAFSAATQQDTDFHVLRNNVEIFGAALSGGQAAGYTNTVVLAAGDTVDFVVGRGADNSHFWSQLKVEATLKRSLATNSLVRLATCAAPVGRFAFTCNAVEGNYVVETSSDLRNWSVLTNLAGARGLTEIIVPQATSSHRFYRARRVP